MVGEVTPARTTTCRLRTRRTYVLDTSVLLSDPSAATRFAEHAVVIPLVVVMELEGKRHDPELGWAARQALRQLETFRVAASGRLDSEIPVNGAGGTVRVELNSVDPSGLPVTLQSSVNDHRILAVAHNLRDSGLDVVVVSKDLPMRLKASLAGLGAEEYRSEQVEAAEMWTGRATLEVPTAVIDEIYKHTRVSLAEAEELPANTCVTLVGPRSSALARVRGGCLRLVPGRDDFELFGTRARSSEQRLAMALLADPDIGIVSLGGAAGTGKSVLALSAALQAVVEDRTHRRVMVFRPLYAVGGQNLGYLPGEASAKMAPWEAAVFDALEAIAGPEVVEQLVCSRQLEVLPLTHLRGRTLSESYIILDEAQNWERSALLSALSRVGPNSRVFITHDIAQRDNLRVGRGDGIAAVVEALKGQDLFAHLTLVRSERSEIAGLVTKLLDGPLW
jgi:PhoH-like ATPase